ncbi:MAG: hypothetical protein R6V56_02465 [Lentisphaeria bacterium]
MKHNPAEDAIRKRMAPGELSLDGFLGEDNRSIAEIVDADVARLEMLGVSREKVADVIDAIHRVADEGLETEREMCDGKLHVRMEEGMGGIPCPFGCGYQGHKGIIHVKMPDREISLTPLHGHLIREHGFFQGRGSVFRLAPDTAAELCRLCGKSADN